MKILRKKKYNDIGAWVTTVHAYYFILANRTKVIYANVHKYSNNYTNKKNYNHPTQRNRVCGDKE